MDGALSIRRIRKRTPGDLMVLPFNNTNLKPLVENTGERVAIIEIPVSPWIATMSRNVGAGFYMDNLGPLPFSFGAVPSEKYYIVRLGRDNVSRNLAHSHSATAAEKLLSGATMVLEMEPRNEHSVPVAPPNRKTASPLGDWMPRLALSVQLGTPLSGDASLEVINCSSTSSAMFASRKKRHERLN